ncbi:MAG: dipicolinate synthase subunit DpsA [Peptococcaceae bacterium]|nr:dipicolinate synthase subunit DpsA [Peptococcaceae bacterium]
MSGKKKKRILMVGGDERDLYLLQGLTAIDAIISAFALPKKMLPSGVSYCLKLEKAFALADVIILPMPGIANDGKLYAPLMHEDIYLTSEQWQKIKADTLVLVGSASELLKTLAKEGCWELVETAELDEIAIPNAIPTAEGAIKIAVEETPFTIDGAEVIILGYGRVGEALAKKIRGLNGHVTVLNRGKKRLEAAKEDGFQVGMWRDFAEITAQGDIVYNTIPSLVLTGKVIAKMKKSTCIIDLAAKPGGTDFAAAKEQGVAAMLAPGLPGKVAPQTAGELLAKIYPEIIAQFFEEQANREQEQRKSTRTKGQSVKQKATEEQAEAITEAHKVRIRKKAISAATTKINGKVHKAQKKMAFFEQSGEEVKKTESKGKKTQRAKVKNKGE